MKRNLALGGLLLGACVSDLDIFDPDRSPVAVIYEPVANARLGVGTHTFVAQVSDPTMDPNAVYVVWRLGGADPETDGWTDACGNFAEVDGTSRCTTTLTEDHEVVRLVARNPAGFTRVADVPIRVELRELPEVRWVSPLPPGPFYAAQLTSLEVAVTHLSFEPQRLVLEWVGDRTGPIDAPSLLDAQGGARTAIALPPGMNSLTVAATDPAGGRATATTTVLVRPPNATPSCEIQDPADGQGIELGEPVLLRGLAFDDETPPEALEVSWRSSRFGVLGRPEVDRNGRTELMVPGLASGNHTITLEVTDDGGAVCEDEIDVVVGRRPQLSIDTPADGAQLTLGSPVTLTARASDDASAAPGLALRWFLDGAAVPGPEAPDVSGSASVTFSSLDAGVRRLGVEVVNTIGLDRYAEIAVTVGSP